MRLPGNADESQQDPSCSYFKYPNEAFVASVENENQENFTNINSFKQAREGDNSPLEVNQNSKVPVEQNAQPEKWDGFNVSEDEDLKAKEHKLWRKKNLRWCEELPQNLECLTYNKPSPDCESRPTHGSFFLKPLDRIRLQNVPDIKKKLDMEETEKMECTKYVGTLSVLSWEDCNEASPIDILEADEPFTQTYFDVQEKDEQKMKKSCATTNQRPTGQLSSIICEIWVSFTTSPGIVNREEMVFNKSESWCKTSGEGKMDSTPQNWKHVARMLLDQLHSLKKLMSLQTFFRVLVDSICYLLTYCFLRMAQRTGKTAPQDELPQRRSHLAVNKPPQATSQPLAAHCAENLGLIAEGKPHCSTEQPRANTLPAYAYEKSSQVQPVLTWLELIKRLPKSQRGAILRKFGGLSEDTCHHQHGTVYVTTGIFGNSHLKQNPTESCQDEMQSVNLRIVLSYDKGVQQWKGQNSTAHQETMKMVPSFDDCGSFSGGRSFKNEACREDATRAHLPNVKAPHGRILSTAQESGQVQGRAEVCHGKKPSQKENGQSRSRPRTRRTQAAKDRSIRLKDGTKRARIRISDNLADRRMPSEVTKSRLRKSVRPRESGGKKDVKCQQHGRTTNCSKRRSSKNKKLRRMLASSPKQRGRNVNKLPNPNGKKKRMRTNLQSSGKQEKETSEGNGKSGRTNQEKQVGTEKNSNGTEEEEEPTDADEQSGRNGQEQQSGAKERPNGNDGRRPTDTNEESDSDELEGRSDTNESSEGDGSSSNNNNDNKRLDSNKLPSQTPANQNTAKGKKRGCGDGNGHTSTKPPISQFDVNAQELASEDMDGEPSFKKRKSAFLSFYKSNKSISGSQTIGGDDPGGGSTSNLDQFSNGATAALLELSSEQEPTTLVRTSGGNQRRRPDRPPDSPILPLTPGVVEFFPFNVEEPGIQEDVEISNSPEHSKLDDHIPSTSGFVPISSPPLSQPPRQWRPEDCEDMPCSTPPLSLPIQESTHVISRPDSVSSTSTLNDLPMVHDDDAWTEEEVNETG